MAEEQKQAPESAPKKKKSVFHRIVNVFLYIMLGLLVLLLIAVGITQTSTFREFARETVIEEVNKTLNGRLYIEKIEGTIFTSLILRNTSLTIEGDTLFRADAVEVRTSPLQLLFKKIFIRKAEIRNAKIALITDETGAMNISKLVAPSEEDTATSEFPFKIQVSDFTLKNVDFTMQRYDHKGSLSVYDSLNLDDFRISDLNMSLTAFADINNNNFEIGLRRLSLNTNIRSINIKEISGGFFANQEGLTAEDLVVRTERSEIEMNAALTDINVFDSTADFSHALLHTDIKAGAFHFADITAFVPSFDLLKDAISFNISAAGSFKQLEISDITVDYKSTHLSLAGMVKNLDEPDNMYINTEFGESQATFEDLNSLMPGLQLPDSYKQTGIIHIDTLHYFGSPLNFTSHIFVRTDAGNIYANSILDFRSEDMIYDVNFRTYNLNLSPFTGVSSDINSEGIVKGKGTDPASMNSIIDFNASGSHISGNKLSELHLKSEAKNSIINFSIGAVRDTSNIQLMGFLDMTNETNPVYEFKGSGSHINIAAWTGDSMFVSDINFNIDAMGESFDLDEMNLFLGLNIYDSELNKSKIDSSRAIVDLRKDDSGERVINIISDIADVSITGNYSLDKSISLINKEIELLSTIISQKLNEIIPVDDTLIEKTVQLSKEEIADFETAPGDSSTRIKYLIDLKDFTFATLFLGDSQLEIDGEIFGDLYNYGDSITVTFGLKMDYLKYRTAESAMFLSNLKLDFDLSNNLKAESFTDISSSLKLKIDRIFAGQDIQDINLNLKLQNQESSINFFANYNGNTSLKLAGGFGFKGGQVNLLLDTMNINYRNLNIRNLGRIDLSYDNDRVEFRNFVLSKNGSSLTVKGLLNRGGSQDLIVSLDSVKVGDILSDALGIRPENRVDALLNLKTHITGNMESPAIKMDMAIDSVSYKGRNFGSLLTNIAYAKRNIDVNIRFDEVNTAKEVLLIKGNIPMDLSFAGESDFKPGPMNVTIKADNFNLGAFGDLLPQVNKLGGNFSAEMKITGTTEKFQPSGYIALSDVTFLSEFNNLAYRAGMHITIDGSNVMVDSILIQNTGDVKDGGSISGNGSLVLDGFSPKTAQFSVGGRLKVLSQNSRYAASPIYGDLVVRTLGNIEFTMNEDRAFLKAPIELRNVDITIPPTQGAYQNTNPSFVYKFVQDTVDTSAGRMDIQSLIEYSKNVKSETPSATKESSFDYIIDLSIEDESRVVFVLSREINQNLTAVLSGKAVYENVGGRSDIQGEFKLMEGSTLEFIKTFRADGSIRFESDITNPYLNITATYIDYYYPADSAEGLNEVKVGVKIKLKGPLSELDKNFVREEDNIAVYYGEENIDEDEPDPTRDASDAVMFIITGRFTEDLNQSERTQAAGQFTGAATSIAGSLLGGVLNNYFGEYVSGVELRRVGSETRFVFTGRAGTFRYQVGGSQEVFQNISQANVRIEYPIYKGLSFRFERREDVRERAVINEMVNEIGLRYRFEF